MESSAETSVKAAPINFSFASPAAEDLTNDDMEGIFRPQPSPENLRHQLEDPPSLNLSHNEEIARDNPTEPSFSFENITISEENQETASEETESPGLDFWSPKLPQGPPVQSALWVQRTTATIPSLIREDHAGLIPEHVTTPDAEEITLDMPVTELLRRLQADLRQTRNTIRLTQAEVHTFPFS